MSVKIEITLEAPFTPDDLQVFLSDCRNNGIPSHDELQIIHTFSPGYDDRFIVDGQIIPIISTVIRAVSE